MKVCDRCRKKDDVKELKFEDKTYDICKSCHGKIKKFLSTEEKKGVFDMFK